MEITMYEDNNYSRENVAQMKRKFTLDLNGRSSKKLRAHGQVNFNPLLTSPDLNMLKLASPELDQLVLQQGCLLPNGFNFPSVKASAHLNSEEYAVRINTSNSTVSSEEFVKGFQDTLEQLHHKAPEVVTSTVPITVSASSEIQYTQLEVQPPQQQVPVTTSCGDDNIYIKDEPQIVPVCRGTPPVSPINMETQEIIKLERKRLRNRIAASKCRRRKLERISKLEDKVSILKAENTELQAVVNRMRDQVCSLKQEVMEHVNSGCEIPFLSATQCQ